MSTKAAKTTETQETAVEGNAVQESKTESVIYVGPTIPGVATHNTVFNNGLPQGLTEAQEKEPAFKALVIPVKSLAAAGNDIANKRGAIYTFYEKAANYKA